MRWVVAGAVLVAAFVGALLIGKGGGEGEPEANAPADVKALTVPAASTKAPRLANTGPVPALQKTPEPASTPSTTSTSGSGATTGAGSTGSTGGGSTGGGSTGGGSTGGGDGTPQVRAPG